MPDACTYSYLVFRFAFCPLVSETNSREDSKNEKITKTKVDQTTDRAISSVTRVTLNMDNKCGLYVVHSSKQIIIASTSYE
mmetsp:Transcript_20194/g.47284  ORF Transcript_20194/g.47284 Transcript_20194/m.47284 type:complete len:81 (+) Transcript_20194:2356-2598(+)